MKAFINLVLTFFVPKRIPKNGIAIVSETSENRTLIIFEIIFKSPPEDSDIRDLHSFRGLIRLIKKYIPEKAYEIMMGIPGHARANGFVQELFGPAAQNQYANDDTSDEEYKTAALSIYLEEFPSFLTPKFLV